MVQYCLVRCAGYNDLLVLLHAVIFKMISLVCYSRLLLRCVCMGDIVFQKSIHPSEIYIERSLCKAELYMDDREKKGECVCVWSVWAYYIYVTHPPMWEQT